MKALTLATVCLLATSSYAQDTYNQPAMPVANPTPAPTTTTIITPAPQAAPVVLPGPPPVPQNQAVAPAVFYAPASGDRTVTPQALEVEVPVYAPSQIKAKVQKIYTEISTSQFFVELNPLSLKISTLDFQSNYMEDGNRALEFDTNDFKARLVPLDFKFGFENQGWGSFAEVLISDGEDSSDLTIYAKLGEHKLGGGMVLSSYDYDAKIKRFGATTGTGSANSVEVGSYFYASFQLSNDDSISVEQWNKIGGFYEDTSGGGVTVKGVSFVFNPALDIMFKINPKLQIGTGMEFEYRRFSGDVQVNSLPKRDGVGNSFSFELNLIKTKFLF
ncbi:hypothetical protein SHI21_12835 [Bacteriovorax sp. PP10]|uniref:Outer membrane protein beta-barrel domain-containing protein n=1 Tax=Bacteriovorax antarcticus TaxID=3088717 RepID=A0ABU5VVL4_9BACT|nr:hypothetical protein [Bacteriovorax sp. PP10]MEA9357103.1 hypothetical protein [Bacteriovorax sp. PP10]